MTSWIEERGDGSPRGGLLPRRTGSFSVAPNGVGRERMLAGQSIDGQQTVGDLNKYVRILRDRWKIVVAAFVVVTGGVVAANAVTEATYRASGTIEIRKQAAEVVPVEAMFQFERISDQYLQTQYTMLRSPTLIRRTLSDPAIAAKLPAAEDGDVSLPDDRRVNKLVARIRSGLSVAPVVGSRIVRVSFESTDPILSADFVNALIAEYIAMREEAGVAALARLAEQADAVRAQVLQAEREVQSFVQEHQLGIVVGTGGEPENVPQERLRRLQQELTEAETEGFRAEAHFSGDQAQRTAALDSDLLKTLRARIAELQGEYARVRSTFTDSFPRARQMRHELAQLDSLVASEQMRVSSAMSSQHRATVRRSTLLREAVNEQRRQLDTIAAKIAEYERLKRELDGHKQLYASLQQKRKEASLSSALSAMDVAVLDPAVPVMTPVRPLPRRDIPLGALTGLILGIGLAFLRHHSDTTVKTHEQVENLSSVPLLALIPALRAGPPTARTSLDLDSVAEAFRGLRTSVLYESSGPLPQTLLITSTMPGDGKTFVSANLAISLAMLGRRVLLVDADLRRHSLEQVFRIRCETGLSDYLAGAVPWRDALCRDVREGLDLLPSRTDSRNPADLLSSAAVRRFMAEAKSEYDFVIVDSPALFINAPDSRILAQAVEGVVFVVRSGATPRDLVQRLLDHTPNLVGVVLNGVDERSLPAYYRDYTAVTSGEER